MIAAACPLEAAAECSVKILGEGTIRVCRNWNLMGEHCREYEHVKLPPSITEGDVFVVRYGSNPKSYEFHVGRIATLGDVCSIFPHEGGYNLRDRIIAACQSCPAKSQNRRGTCFRVSSSIGAVSAEADSKQRPPRGRKLTGVATVELRLMRLRCRSQWFARRRRRGAPLHEQQTA